MCAQSLDVTALRSWIALNSFQFWQRERTGVMVQDRLASA